jgi:hypothetical protein
MRVNAATDPFADAAGERDAMGRCAIGSVHTAEVRRNRFNEFIVDAI